MNLHGIVAGQIGAVNPFITVSIQVSTGSTPSANGQRVPTYAPAVERRAQVQPASYKDLQMVDGLNQGGERRKIYLYGVVDGLVRVENKGGDLITISGGVNAGVWLVNQTIEQWPDWVAAVITLQNGG